MVRRKSELPSLKEDYMGDSYLLQHIYLYKYRYMYYIYIYVYINYPRQKRDGRHRKALLLITGRQKELFDLQSSKLNL